MHQLAASTANRTLLTSFLAALGRSSTTATGHDDSSTSGAKSYDSPRRRPQTSPEGFAASKIAFEPRPPANFFRWTTRPFLPGQKKSARGLEKEIRPAGSPSDTTPPISPLQFDVQTCHCHVHTCFRLCCRRSHWSQRSFHQLRAGSGPCSGHRAAGRTRKQTGKVGAVRLSSLPANPPNLLAILRKCTVHSSFIAGSSSTSSLNELPRTCTLPSYQSSQTGQPASGSKCRH